MTRTTIRSEDITDGQVKAADLASDAVDTTGIQTDIAILGFKVAANGSLAKYDLVDQAIDAFEDASGVDASASTNEVRNASNYYSGGTSTAGSSSSFTTAETTSWDAPAGLTTVTYLVVAGGGEGGWDAGGGGGAGGYRAGTLTVSGGSSYTVTVGAGGTSTQAQTPASARFGADGGDSVFSSITATGGGGAGSTNPSKSGRAGGSGGGGGGHDASGGSGGAGNAGSFSPVEGYIGGAGSNGAGGGGGGSSGAGTIDASPSNVGGAGTSNSITGSAVTYAAGGAGFTDSGSGSASGGANTGDGGNGGGGTPQAGAGGSGIVVVKWDAYNAPADLTLISNATTAEAEPTKGDIVMTYTNGAGTATINTDIKGWVSRDNGTTYTQFTLADEGDTGGHIILTAHDLDISGQPSGSAMRYKITTHNQSASKETRIQAVSLGWS
jgi:hypothetical protein